MGPVVSGAWGAGLTGLLIASLTMRLDSQLEGAWWDRLVLATLMAFGYGIVGAVVGLRGARVELSVYDVAPLVLELLGYPPASDMPASGRRAYLETLAPAGRAAKGLPAIASYGRTATSDRAPRASPQRVQTMEELRSLGYVD